MARGSPSQMRFPECRSCAKRGSHICILCENADRYEPQTVLDALDDPYPMLRKMGVDFDE